MYSLYNTERIIMYIDLMSPKTSNDTESISKNPNAKNVFIETYGCQMNISDSEIVGSILSSSGYQITNDINVSDVIFLNTCSVRDNAEKKIFNRLTQLRQYKKKKRKLVVGIIGCMAERLKDNLIGERDLVSIVVGPDEYRSIPSLVDNALEGQQGIAVKLSKVETYDDIVPLRTEGLSAWITIMRGCNNYCSYCVVPYTRGREKSRPLTSIVDEVKGLFDSGIKEVTLLGQNVNSYRNKDTKIEFHDLLIACAKARPEMRIRYSTSHPHDFSDELIEAHANYKNICNYIHLPFQSGSNSILKKMRRDYTAEEYLKRIEALRKAIPDAAISTDVIAGFCTESLQDHQDTLDLMKEVRYDGAYMFKYSVRDNTLAYKYEDDVPEEEKSRRLQEIIDQQNQISKEINEKEIGKIHEVLIEGESKKNKDEWQGRSDTNKVCIFDYNDGLKAGDYVNVKINRSTSATLFGEIV